MQDSEKERPKIPKFRAVHIIAGRNQIVEPEEADLRKFQQSTASNLDAALSGEG
ncbi:MAG: hypothetical protein U0930_22060 [Pirellulales bacterium]